MAPEVLSAEPDEMPTKGIPQALATALPDIIAMFGFGIDLLVKICQRISKAIEKSNDSALFNKEINPLDVIAKNHKEVMALQQVRQFNTDVDQQISQTLHDNLTKSKPTKLFKK